MRFNAMLISSLHSYMVCVTQKKCPAAYNNCTGPDNAKYVDHYSYLMASTGLEVAARKI